MTIGLLKEPGYETRVSLLAEAVATLTKKGIKIQVETGAGDQSFCSDADYQNAGAEIKTRVEVLTGSDIILSIQTPETNDIQQLKDKILIGVYQPLYKLELMQSWAAAGMTTFSLDMLPRTTRAQAMDVLSSQANIAGYKAVLLAANLYPRYFPMFMTAAGTIAPAKILVLGAGVAGLQAVATARRLGAVVEVFDTRPAVKEEVMSLGAKFVEVEGAADASKGGGYAVEQTEDYKQKQQERISQSVAKSDIIITTAQIPGKKAPVLITTAMMDLLRSGSVVIDLAAATGGNTPFTKNNETVVRNGVTIVGNSSLQSSAPSDASKMYGKNVLNFLQLILAKESLNWEDDLLKGSGVTHAGAVINEKIKSLVV